MVDRRKVIASLQRMSTYFKSMMAVGWQGDMEVYQKHRETVNMAIELLKEQEAKEQIADAIHETAKQFRQTIVLCKDCRHYDPTFMFCNNLETHSVYAEFGCIEGEKFPEINT